MSDQPIPPGASPEMMAVEQERICNLLRCSFCGKGRSDVETLVQGPGVQICNECVSVCADICKPGVPAHG